MFASVPAAAQVARSPDSVRVLRFQPDSAATPVAPVVITFDRPVAPELDASIAPDSVLTITPEKPHHAYWRDPSTLVAEFDTFWAPGSRYEVRLAPRMRADGGRPLAAYAPWRVRVQMPRLLEVMPVGAAYEEHNQYPRVADPSAHVNLVFSNAVSAQMLDGRIWFVGNACGPRDSVRLDVLKIRPLAERDSYYLKEAGGYDRDRRLDSLRRVVEVRATRPPSRGCTGILRVPAFAAPQREIAIRIAPVFSLESIETGTPQGEQSTCAGRWCEAGVLSPRFTQPVSPEQLLAHVRIDGRAPRFVDNVLRDTLHAGRRARLSIDAALTSRFGERIGRSLDTVLSGWQRVPALGLANGQVVLPRRSTQLLRIRFSNTDSVRVIIARVTPALRARALGYTGNERDPASWSRLVRDSVVRVVVARADSLHEGTLDVPSAWVPERWGDDAPLLIRALPAKIVPRPQRSGGAVVTLPTVTVVPSDYLREPHFAVVQRSDLAVHVARHEDEAEVWVTGRATGAPVPGARVSFVRGGERRSSTTTSAMGVAHLSGVGARTVRDIVPDRHVEIEHAGDRVLLALPRDAARGDRGVPSDSTHTANLATRGTLSGVAFSDRGIYRPGQRVFVKGIARTYRSESGYRAPAGDSARWTLTFERDGSREPIATRVGRLGDFGSHSDSLELPATARVGGYRAAFAVRDRLGWRDAAETRFSIAEYRVPEFAVKAIADTSVPLYAGDSATIRVEGRYLYGPPMANAAVNAVVHTSDDWGPTPQVKALDGFEVGRSPWLDDERRNEPDEQPNPTHLGTDGTLVMRVPSRRITRPGVLSVSVMVQDANRQTIAASTSVPLRVADAFVGVRTAQRRWDWTSGAPIPIEAVVVRGDGSLRPGTRVGLAAYRIEWRVGHWQRDTTWRDSLTSGDGPVRASFTPAVPGWYEIVASTRDERGRIAESSTHVGVMGAGWRGRPGGLFLSIEKNEVSTGDTVTAILEASADLLAWASLRDRGTRWQQLLTLKRGINVLKVPVPTNSARFAELHVLATRAVSAGPKLDTDVPYVIHVRSALYVTDSARMLRVRVASERPRYQPRDTVRLSVNVSDHRGRGRRSELAVWAVDQGVVSLTEFAPPPILEQLLQGRYENWWLSSTLLGTLFPGPPGLAPLFSRYGFHRADVTGAAASVALESMVVAGYDARAEGVTVRIRGVSATPTLRYRFVTTPFFAGSLVTDTAGRATTSFVLPDNVTTYRLFAVAVDDEVRAGTGDTTIVTTRPLVVRAALPRIVRTGDSLYAGAVLTREGGGDAATPVKLTVRADGMHVDGAPVADDTLVGALARERRFAMRVHARDSVTVDFTATSPRDGDAVYARLPVSAPGRPRARVAMGTLRSDETAELDLPDDIDLARSRLVLQTGQSPLPLLRELDERLRVYPYACTEQIASAARALIARVRLERTLGERTTLAPEDRHRLEIAVHLLLDRQRHDGGFGYWGARHWTTPWLTSRALDVLLGARELGVSVPQSAIDLAARYLGSDRVMGEYYRREWLAYVDSSAWAHEALYAARALRRLARPDTALERQVWARRAELDFEDRLVLALLRAAGGDSAGARSLVDAAWRSTRVEGRRVVVEDSVVRRRWQLFRAVTSSYTGLLRATAALRPRHPQLAPLLESLLQSARSDAVARWNTVDQSTLAETIEAVVAPLGLSTGARLSVTDASGVTMTHELQPRSADSLTLALERFVVDENGRRAVRVKLASPSESPVYYALTLLEVPIARPVRPDQEGIAVERWYERYEDGRPVTEVKEGDLVRVRLRITAPRDREFVVIDDPLPAGLEAVDQSLRTTGSLPPYAGAPRLEGDSREGPIGQKWLYGSWDGGWWTPWEHKEMRDDRVLWFARQLWRGSYQASYVARATTAGRFVRPPAQAEEMYNPAVHGRSDGGVFSVHSAKPLAPNR